MATNSRDTPRQPQGGGDARGRGAPGSDKQRKTRVAPNTSVNTPTKPEKSEAERAQSNKSAEPASDSSPRKQKRPSPKSVAARSGHSQIIVLGMHRSGTSALTGALARMGVFVGDEDELTGRNWENPEGFFERKDARGICDALLHGSGADWWKVSAFDPENVDHIAAQNQRPRIEQLVKSLDSRGGSWALKEPRLCLLMPLFRSALKTPFAIIVYRHPVEVARSLRRRNGFPIRVGLALWEAYNVAALRHGSGLKHIVVSYDDLLEQPDKTLRDVALAIKAAGSENLDVDAAVNGIVPALRRERLGGAEEISLLTPAQNELWSYLQSAQTKKAPGLSADALATLREFEVDEAERVKLRADLNKTESQLRDARGAISDRDTRLKDAQVTISDRDTKLKDARAAISDRDTRLKDAQVTLGDRDAMIERLKNENNKLQTALSAAEDSTASLESEISKIRANLAQEERDRQAMEGQHEIAQRELALIKERSDDLKTDRASLQSRVMWLEGQIFQLIRNHNESYFADDVRRNASGGGPVGSLWRRVVSGVTRSPGPESLERRRRALSLSPLFDAQWYASRHLDVLENGYEVIDHYLLHGDAEGRDPHPLFSRSWYIKQSEKVIDPRRSTALETYLEDPSGCSPHPLFDAGAYAGEMGVPLKGALSHYLQMGAAMGAKPNPFFDPRWYLETYRDAASSRLEPLTHYVLFGAARGHKPSPHFSPSKYLEAYADVRRSGIEPLEHYLSTGRAEGRLAGGKNIA